MSKLLETIKPELTRSRNLAYYGKYSEAIAGFNDLIEKVNAQIAAISDKTLITEWNRFRDDLKSQRDLASNLKQQLEGNFDSQQAKREKQSIPEECSAKELSKMKKNPSYYQIANDQNFAQPTSFKKQLLVHEDDELYN